MNILFITNHLNTGGITSYVFTLASGLRKRGHNLYIASSGGERALKFKEAGIDYISIPMRTKKEISLKIIFSLIKLSSIIRKNKIDIVHSHSRTTQVLGCLLGKITKARHIFTCHGFFKRRLLRRTFPCWGEKVIAISEQVREHLVKDFKLDEKKIVVIHNGIDVDRFRRQKTEDRRQNRISLGLGDGPVIGIIARLSDVKGHEYLIEAMKPVLEKYPVAQLLIIGTGKTKEGLIRLAASLGISSNVFFVPQTQDTAAALAAMDIFVMPSLQEGLGLALMEAMASGRAVVASGVGGIKTLIQDGRDGLLVEPADSQELARAILTLLDDPVKRTALAKEAQAFIQQNFSQEKMVLETEEEYSRCLGVKD
ncbi:MAG: glycosyltransferase family 4 protein [Candidatus Omnitrophota bacterium]|nr:glycosyltransferase family 4 protein [Candidatus Omnitrophota bacterium]